jgi:phytoene synthase
MNNFGRSYRLCGKITKQKARNFFYAFLLLPRNRRKAIYAVYAFMRHCDDIVDATASANRLAELTVWRETVKSALEGRESDNPILPAFVDTVKMFNIPHHYFFDLLDGVQMDLEKDRYETFHDLYQYCYRVAGVVGLVCLHIFGFKEEKALALAEGAGIAFQITNILRDLREDAERNRIYLPLEDLKRFRYPEESLKQGLVNDHFRRLLHFETERARDYYHQAEPLIGLVSPDCQRALAALIGIYRGLLEKIYSEHERLFEKQIRLTLLEKIGIVLRAWRSPLPAFVL